MHYIWGIIHYYDEENRIIGIKKHHQINYYILTRSQLKRFGIYLHNGVFVYFFSDDKSKIKHGFKVNEVKNFIKLKRTSARNNATYYDMNQIKEGVRNALNKPGFRLYLDLEFTMPPYSHKHGMDDFYSEIISYGMYLEDEDNNVIDEYYGYVKPLNQIGLSDRTLEFLKVDKNKIINAPKFYKFYNILKDIMVYYQPTIYVWGRNDILELEKSYERYNLKPITAKANFINLMQVMKTYYSIKDDIGLYNAYSLFNHQPLQSIQDHNPLHDALATLEIYHLFIDQIRNK